MLARRNFHFPNVVAAGGRALVSKTFLIDKCISEKTLEFAPGDWLLSSYIATGIENVPIFIKADNAEKEIEKYLSR
jgi:hypothetical protein